MKRELNFDWELGGRFGASGTVLELGWRVIWIPLGARVVAVGRRKPSRTNKRIGIVLKFDPLVLIPTWAN